LNPLSDMGLGKNNHINGHIAFEVPQGSSKNYKLKYIGRPEWSVVTDCS
jgi:hypothetical protein